MRLKRCGYIFLILNNPLVYIQKWQKGDPSPIIVDEADRNMEERKRIIYIILILSALVLCVGIFSNMLLYKTSFERTRDGLSDSAMVLAHFVESQMAAGPGGTAIVGSEAYYIWLAGRIDNAIKLYERHNRRMEITVARRKAGEIHFIAALRRHRNSKLPPVVGVHSGLAEPMCRALEGKSGTMVGKDYHGATVLAAYEPVTGLNLGVVAKIDISDIRAPFIRAGLVVAVFSTVIIFFGILAVKRVSNPIIESLEEKAAGLAVANEDLAAANEELASANEELTASNEELDAANEELQAAMEEMEQTNEQLLRSQADLDRSEQRVQTLLNFSPVGIITADRDSRRFVYANPSACAMFGYDRDEMLAIGVQDIHPPGDIERVNAEFRSLLDRDIGVSRDLPCLKKDGSVFYADISAVTVEYDGRPCLLGQFIDVTERKKAEDALRESEERFSKAFHLSPISMAISSDLDGIYIDVNDEFLALTGYGRDEVLGRTPEDLDLWVDKDQDMLLRGELSAGGTVHDRQVEIRTKDGRILTVLYSAVAATIHGMPCMIKSAIDISDRVKAEAALRESEEKFAKAFMNAPVLMSITDPENERFIDVNDQFVAKSGFGRDQLIGRSSRDIGWVTAEDRERLREMARRDGAIRGVSLRVYPKAGGPRDIMYYGDSITIGGTTRLLSIAVDMTELKRVEQELLAQKDLAQKYLDIAAVMFVALSRDQRVTLVNRKACEALGYPAEKIQGANWFDMFIPARIREDVRSVFNSIMTEEMASVEYYENAVLTASGDERLVAWHNTLLRDASGAITGTLSSGEDITEWKKSEEDLHDQLALNMALAGISGSIISRSFTVTETAYMVLEYARLLSESEFGFVSEIDPDTGDNIARAATKMNDWMPPGEDQGEVIFRKGGDGLYPGLWGHALNTKREFFTNDPAGHPASKGAPEVRGGITRFLSVPVLFGGALVGQVALANSARDYTGDDLKMARRLGSVYAMAIVRIRDESMLMKSLEEKTVLIKELHHRVKNNMQVVSSLISLQARKIDDEKYRAIFMESSNRIQAMAMVHEKMYHSGDMARVDFSRYAREIAERLLYSFSLEPGQVELEVDVRDIFLGIDEAVPCGIILNELITNAFKHAFKDGRRGKLAIRFTRENDGRHRLVVQDDGPGMPERLVTSAEESLGMQIVTALTRQLDGTISINGAGGTRVELVF